MKKLVGSLNNVLSIIVTVVFIITQVAPFSWPKKYCVFVLLCAFVCLQDDVTFV